MIRFGLCGVMFFDKYIEWINYFHVTFDDEDGLVDGDDNWCWREEMVWWNEVKDIKNSGEIFFSREKDRRFDSQIKL